MPSVRLRGSRAPRNHGTPGNCDFPRFDARRGEASAAAAPRPSVPIERPDDAAKPSPDELVGGLIIIAGAAGAVVVVFFVVLLIIVLV